MDIAEEVRKDFLEYAMSVIVSRALPDLKDGLKPVHRRIIYAMNDLGITADKPHKKSARIVGEVIGKYHPHGDTAVYDSMLMDMVTLDQSMVMELLRCVILKLVYQKSQNFIIKDIDLDTVPFVDNYDASEREPAYLTGYFPNLLANGAVGIAVGMATSIPPHNLREVVSAITALIDNRDITIDEILDNHIMGPDFPTGALMTNGQRMREGYKTGRGGVTIRARVDIEETDRSARFIITEIPYQTNKAKIIERIAELVKEKVLDGISDIRDESSYEGIRVVVELKQALHTALDNIDEIVAIIKNSKTSDLAKQALTDKFNFDEEQNKAILDMRLQRLVGLERDRILDEMKQIQERITYLDKLISDENEQNTVLKDQLQDIANKFGDDRRTETIGEGSFNIEDEELIPDVKTMILLSDEGYIRRIDPEEFRIQNVVVVVTKAYNIRQYSRTARGLPIINFLNGLTNEDKITAILPLRNTKEKFQFLTFITEKGMIKRTPINLFDSINQNGKIAIGLKENDQLVTVMPTTGEETIFIANKSGKVIRIQENIVRPLSRTASGVKAIKLDTNDIVVGAATSFGIEAITTISSKGSFKKTSIDEYRISGRNGKGIKVMNINEKTGKFSSIIAARETDLICIISSDGNLIKTKVSDIPTLGRSAAGVRGIRLADGHEIKAVTLEYRKHGEEHEEFEEE
ncbi:hypothetical protein FQA39_LY13023 [Lamprigera yunnana]|nr:hypothetical protein FQA39_LY13023 [Lamprigera yunnana]